MRQKLKPDLDLESIQSDLIEMVCNSYKNGVSVRALAKKFELSPMKIRKILITGGVYSTDLSTEVAELYKDGKTIQDIAELLSMTPANVNSYLPYERIIYNMDEKSVEADRQQRYRDRLRAGRREEKKNLPKIERSRTNTMIIVVGKKLRRMLPEGVLDNTSDPLVRGKSFTWGSNEGGKFVIHEAPDPDKSIWCAELTTAGRGKNKKVGVALMSANCGFAVMSALPTFPFNPEDGECGEEKRKALKDYRKELEEAFLSAIKDGLLSFALPEDRVLDYTDTISRIELVKGRTSTPMIRLEELIERELDWESGDDPVKQFNVRGNWTNRKFGNGDYRRVDAAVQRMLGLGLEESQKWLFDFLKPDMEKLRRRES